MTHSEKPSFRPMPFFIALLGAFIGAAFFFGITMDIAAAVILGAPIGLLVGIVGYHAAPRLMHRNDSRAAQLNGAAPTPTVEEQAKPSFRM